VIPRSRKEEKVTPEAILYEKRIRLPLNLPSPPLRFVESYFEFETSLADADVFASLFNRAPAQDWRNYGGFTRLIDLRGDLDRLFAVLGKDTRYEIRRAEERDGVESMLLMDPTKEEAEDFIGFYDDFAASKELPPINQPQVHALRQAGGLALSRARNRDGESLVWHGYIVKQNRARLTHSASLFRLQGEAGRRAELGRANRFLHWSDLVFFRSLGFACYDFGGWYGGSRDDALMKINSFKKEFGGDVVEEWSSFRAGSRLGASYLALRELALRKKR
jgi:hypothetical protein